MSRDGSHATRRSPGEPGSIRRTLAEVSADWAYERAQAPTGIRRIQAALVFVVSAIRAVASALLPYEFRPLRHLGSDIRDGVRRLRATPVFTIFAIVTLALGLGITTGIYSAVHEVLSPPAGVQQPERLVRITRTRGGSGPMMSLAWPEYQELLSQQTSFDRIAGWAFNRSNIVAANQADAGWSELVSGEYFQALGLEPQAGRLIQPADDRPDAAPVAVISDLAWRRWFDRAPIAVGSTVKIDGQAMTIVGIAPAAFSGLFNGGIVPTAVWMPMASARAAMKSDASFDPADRDRHWILVTARLAAGRTLEQATAEITSLSTRMNEANPEAVMRRDGTIAARRAAPPWIVTPVSDVPKIMGADGVIGPMTNGLLVAVGLVLLVACTNLANLMLARSAARRAEWAVRLSLGATRWRLVRESLVESAIVTVVGGLAGLGVARLLMVVLSTELVITRGASLRLQPHLDGQVVVAGLVATFLALVVSGLAPALQASRANMRALLATESGGASTSRWRARRYLIALQVGVSAALVTLAAFSVAQVIHHGRVDLGVDFSRLGLVQVDFAGQHYDADRVRQVVETVVDRASRLPGAESVSVSSGLPVGIGTPGATTRGPAGQVTTEFVAATPALSATLDLTIRKGRAFDARDIAGTAPVALIGEITARELFGDADPIGRTVEVTRRRWAGESQQPSEVRTLVGVVEEVRADRPGRSGVVYVPWAQHYEGDLVFSLRTSGDPDAAVTGLRQLLRDTDPEVAVVQALTGTSLIGQDTLFFQVVGGIASILGTLALVVALAGLYGILSVLVAGRTREIGIRMAIGADAWHIRRSTLREGLSPVVLGLVLGVGLGVLGRMAMRPFFMRLVPALDLTALALVPALFIVAGFVAAYLPARRASRVDPTIALRQL